jgi:shikimate dehydrogenase
MKQYGLIGFPLTHSFSKNYFTQKFTIEGIEDAVYNLFPLQDIAEFPALLEHEQLCGLNVTIPYKEKVIPFLDGLNEEAAAIGAVNTIKFTDGKTTGYNSDSYGFEQSLLPLLQPQHTAALILGTGGASKAVEYVLKKLGIAVQYVSRTPSEKSVTYKNLDTEMLAHSMLLINCTPAGMYPDVDNAPDIPYELITDKHLLYDLIYNPDETRFLREGRTRGAQTKNGLEMLYLQAERSWAIWNKE